ncbi:MAG: hypothetical protein ACI8VJ_000158 [Polaribacter sp.]|jgi:hypothetical protein
MLAFNKKKIIMNKNIPVLLALIFATISCQEKKTLQIL